MSWNSFLKHHSNGQIDWKNSLLKISTKEELRPNRSQAEQDYRKIREKVEKEYNKFLVIHAQKFSELTNLKELNQWINLEAVHQTCVGSLLLFKRYVAAKRIRKKSKVNQVVPPLSKTSYENKKLNLNYTLTLWVFQD